MTSGERKRGPRTGAQRLNSKDGSKSGRVLVVDDDPTLRRLVTSYFEKNDMLTSAVSDRHELSRHLLEGNPCMIILDSRLGQHDGFDLLRDIRSSSDVPVIFTTGQRHDEIDRVVGLELGADDSLSKPFGLRELLARVRAVLRRHELGRLARAPRGGDYKFGGWRLVRHGRRLFTPEGAPVGLTKAEYALLVAFLEAAQRPLTRAQLLTATRVHEDIFDRSVDVQVLRLRRKLTVDANTTDIIETRRGVGYVFTLAVEVC